MTSWAPCFAPSPRAASQSQFQNELFRTNYRFLAPLAMTNLKRSGKIRWRTFGLPVERRATAPEEERARVCGTRDCAERHEVGRSLRIPAGDDQGTRQARPDGHDLPARIRRRRYGLRGVRYGHRGTLSRGRFGRDHRGCAHVTVLEPHLFGGKRSAEEEVCAEAGRRRV